MNQLYQQNTDENIDTDRHSFTSSASMLLCVMWCVRWLCVSVWWPRFSFTHTHAPPPNKYYQRKFSQTYHSFPLRYTTHSYRMNCSEMFSIWNDHTVDCGSCIFIYIYIYVFRYKDMNLRLFFFFWLFLINKSAYTFSNSSSTYENEYTQRHHTRVVSVYLFILFLCITRLFSYMH